METNVAAYAAGLFDGEGTFQIHKDTRESKHYSGGAYYAVRLSMRLTVESPIIWMQQHFGGRIYINQPKGKNNKLQYGWYLQVEKDVEYFTIIVYPYLLIKRKCAMVALNFINREWHTDKELLYKQMKEANA